MPVIDNLDHHHNIPLLLGGLWLPLDNVTNTLIKRFMAAAIGKIPKPRRERLLELGTGGTMVDKKVTRV